MGGRCLHNANGPASFQELLCAGGHPPLRQRSGSGLRSQGRTALALGDPRRPAGAASLWDFARPRLTNRKTLRHARAPGEPSNPKHKNPRIQNKSQDSKASNTPNTAPVECRGDGVPGLLPPIYPAACGHA